MCKITFLTSPLCSLEQWFSTCGLVPRWLWSDNLRTCKTLKEKDHYCIKSIQTMLKRSTLSNKIRKRKTLWKYFHNISTYLWSDNISVEWSQINWGVPSSNVIILGAEKVENHWIRHSNDIQQALIPCKSAS